MIYFVHRGMGGRYTSYVQDSIRKINRVRPILLSSTSPPKPGFRVVICQSGSPLTEDGMRSLLNQEDVTFYFGDSRGMPAELISGSDCVVSVSSLPVPHQMEAIIVADQVGRLVIHAE